LSGPCQTKARAREGDAERDEAITESRDDRGLRFAREPGLGNPRNQGGEFEFGHGDAQTPRLSDVLTRIFVAKPSPKSGRRTDRHAFVDWSA
jgi:hypothetical protein